MLKAKVGAATRDGMSLSVDGGRGSIRATVDGTGSLADADCAVGIRPEHIALSDTGALAGTVIATEMLGSETIVFTALQSGEYVRASVRGIRSHPPGAIVRFTVDRRRFLSVLFTTLSPSITQAGRLCSFMRCENESADNGRVLLASRQRDGGNTLKHQ